MGNKVNAMDTKTQYNSCKQGLEKKTEDVEKRYLILLGSSRRLTTEIESKISIVTVLATTAVANVKVIEIKKKYLIVLIWLQHYNGSSDYKKGRS